VKQHYAAGTFFYVALALSVLQFYEKKVLISVVAVVAYSIDSNTFSNAKRGHFSGNED